MDKNIIYLAQGQPAPTTVNLEIPNPIGLETLTDLLTVIINWIFTISIPIVIAIIIWSGIKFITSRGNPSELQKAKSMLWWAIVGLAIILVGGGFITLINSILALG